MIPLEYVILFKFCVAAISDITVTVTGTFELK